MHALNTLHITDPGIWPGQSYEDRGCLHAFMHMIWYFGLDQVRYVDGSNSQHASFSHQFSRTSPPMCLAQVSFQLEVLGRKYYHCKWTVYTYTIRTEWMRIGSPVTGTQTWSGVQKDTCLTLPSPFHTAYLSYMVPMCPLACLHTWYQNVYYISTRCKLCSMWMLQKS